MKYIIIDQIKNGDMFTVEKDTKQEAIVKAAAMYNALSEHDRRRRSDFFILKSINPNEDAPNHFDGEEIQRWI